MAIIPKGREPVNVKKRIDILFPKLDEAYPDKVIVGLQRDHKKWDETAREISKQLGYENKNDFLTAYGYKIEKLEGGRPSNDYMAIIDELKKRYPNGSQFTKIPELAEANPDLAPKFKSLANQASSLWGMSFLQYLKSIGILTERVLTQKYILAEDEKKRNAIARRENTKSVRKEKLDYVISVLRERYNDPSKILGTLKELKEANNDLPLHYLVYTSGIYGLRPARYLQSIGLISAEVATRSRVQRARQHKTPLPPNGVDFENRIFVYTDNRDIPEENIWFEPLDEHRDWVGELARTNGGIYKNWCTYGMDYLIVEDINGRATFKYKMVMRMQKLGCDIRIISYDDFLILEEEYRSTLVPFAIQDGVLVKCNLIDQLIEVPNEIKVIGSRAFECCRAKEIVIPNGVKEIKTDAIVNCENLERIVLSDTVEKIARYAIRGCFNLKEISSGGQK